MPKKSNYLEPKRIVRYLFLPTNILYAFTKSLTDTPINFLKFFEKVNRELNKHFSPKDATV